MSRRMKYLLQGVRTAVVSRSVEPAQDLDRLARLIDAARLRRDGGDGEPA